MKKVRLTESELISVIKRIISEQSEHVKNLYKSWANKKSGNPEKALALIDDVFKYQKQLSKKDFAQYSSYEELKKDIDKIKQEAKSTDTTKFYEDNDLLVIAANTWEASCKYGAGSKWCTTARDTDSYWQRHNQTGTEFFWIFKNKPQDDPNHKFSYHIKTDGRADWCNAVNYCFPNERLAENSYPKQHPKYNEIVTKLQEFHNKRDFKSVADPTQIQRQIEDNRNQTNVQSIRRLLVNENINIVTFDDIEFEFDFVLDEYLEHGLENTLYTLGREDDYVQDEVDDLRDELYRMVMNSKNNIIRDNLENINDELIPSLAWLIIDNLRRNQDFDNEQPYIQQIEAQNITIADLVDRVINDDEEGFREVLIEDMSTVFYVVFENMFYDLIN